ncbi:hypothetical protein BC830DRAFT_1076727 [Chytriomyces sp. MP71]|nr:hypothetical protein BC830DRAFT_1076727 [Chytriomyces sp. MP71]
MSFSYTDSVESSASTGNSVLVFVDTTADCRTILRNAVDLLSHSPNDEITIVSIIRHDFEKVAALSRTAKILKELTKRFHSQTRFWFQAVITVDYHFQDAVQEATVKVKPDLIVLALLGQVEVVRNSMIIAQGDDDWFFRTSNRCLSPELEA